MRDHRADKGRKKARLNKVQPGIRIKIRYLRMCTATLATENTYRTGINMIMKLYIKKAVWVVYAVFISTSV